MENKNCKEFEIVYTLNNVLVNLLFIVVIVMPTLVWYDTRFVNVIMSYYGACESQDDKAKCNFNNETPSSNSPTTSQCVSARNAAISTSSCMDMTSVDIGEIIEANDSDLMSTSAVLSYCKSKILYPYLRFLSFMGLRPVSLDQLQTSKTVLILWHYHTIQISVLISLGYFLQYMSCFRRDRGFCYKVNTSVFEDFDYQESDVKLHENICYNGSLLSFIAPNILHFSGYIYAIYLFRISDNEQLQNLMERVFLLSSFPPQGTPYTSPRKLVLILWVYILLSIIWTALSLIVVNVMLMNGIIEFHWIAPSSEKLVSLTEILLGLTTLAHDMVQATIITSYCLQAQLLTAHLHFLRNRLLTRTISSLDWMREVAEFKKLLRHFNEVLAPVICIFTLVNISWACSGLIWLMSYDKIEAVPTPMLGINYLNEALWIFASIIPFISAARLTTACSATQAVGHEIIVRPFLHQDTPQEDLNTVLVFASSLQLSARLFRLPITGRYLCLALTVSSIIIFTLGMSHYLKI